MIKNSAAEMAQSLASGTITSVALTQAHLDRIAEVDGKVHAFCTLIHKVRLSKQLM